MFVRAGCHHQAAGVYYVLFVAILLNNFILSIHTCTCSLKTCHDVRPVRKYTSNNDETAAFGARFSVESAPVSNCSGVCWSRSRINVTVEY